MILVTGATSGIGLEAAVALARDGAQVAIVGRDPGRTAAALAEVKQRSGSAQAESFLADFASLDSVRKLAAGVRARHERIDVLVNNAGTVSPARTVTADGFETTFAVNHLAHFLLTNLLLDRLPQGARIINVSSRGHYRGTMDFDNLGYEKGGYQIMRAYCRSKLANVLFTRELHKRYAARGISANALHPGGVATHIWSKAPGWTQPILEVAKLFMLTSEKAGGFLVHLATGKDVEGKSGLYFNKLKEATPSRLARDEALAARLWDESARLVKL